MLEYNLFNSRKGGQKFIKICLKNRALCLEFYWAKQTMAACANNFCKVKFNAANLIYFCLSQAKFSQVKHGNKTRIKNNPIWRSIFWCKQLTENSIIKLTKIKNNERFKPGTLRGVAYGGHGRGHLPKSPKCGHWGVGHYHRKPAKCIDT